MCVATSNLIFEKTMITLQDLSQYLQLLLSPADYADCCPNGLQVEGKTEIRRIAFAVSASLATIEEAVKRGADALIVHHGIFWNKDSDLIVGTKKDKLEHLLKEGISLLAYHLPLDAHPQIGNNWKAAFDLGLKDLNPFLSIGKTAIGVKGKMDPISIEAFQKKLENYYGHPAHGALGGKKEVRSAAIVSGGGHRYIDQAADEDVDCYITGSFDEPIWNIAHERKINFFALGHYSTERVGVIALMAHLQKQFCIPCEFIDLFNPF
jgi:dinuclear metal center YbgI/SA1388 family protein